MFGFVTAIWEAWKALPSFGSPTPVQPPRLTGISAELITIDRGGKKLLEKINSLSNMVVDIGFLKSSGIHPESGMTMANHALELIMGDPAREMPSRDFMTTTLDAYRPEILRATRSAAEAVVKYRKAPTISLRILGEFYADMMKSNIIHGSWAPLHWITIEKKMERGSSHANDILLDTEAMIDSINSRVRRRA